MNWVRDFDERDVAREPAVVPPIGLECWDAVGDAGVVDGENNEVFSVFEDAGDVAVEGSEAAFVLAGFFGVDPDEGAVVGGAEVEEGACVGLGGVLEVALVPDGAFVVEEVGALGVPVTGDFEGAGVGEVVVLGVAVGVEGGVHEEAVFAEVLVEVIEAGGVLVHDDVPVAVEGGGRAVVDVDEQSGLGCWAWSDAAAAARRSAARRRRVETCGIKKSPVMDGRFSTGKMRNRSGDMILRSLNNCLFSCREDNSWVENLR